MEVLGFKVPFTKSNVKAGTTFEAQVGGSLGQLLGGGGYITPTQAFDYYKRCQAVATVIDLIAEPLSDLPFYLEIDGKAVNDHEVLNFLRTPHPDYTGRLFFNALAIHWLLCGEGYIFAGGNFRYAPQYMAPMSPKNISVVQGSDGFVQSFIASGMMYPGTYNRNKFMGRRVFLSTPQTQIKQIRRFSTQDNSQLRGESKLAAAVMDVRQNLAGGNHNYRTLVKGGRLTMLFSIKDDMSPEKFNEAKNRILSQYSGDNGNSIGVVNANQVEVTEMGVNNRDMDFANLQSMTEKAIAKRYGVPLPLISDDASTFNNLATAYQALYDNAVIPNANQLLDGIGGLLFPRFKLDPSRTRFKVDEAAIPAIALRMAEIAEKRRKSYTWTDNELRAEQGLDPVSDGDKLYRPANLLAGGDSPAPKVKPTVMDE